MLRTRFARVVRRTGGDRLLENPRFRRLIGAPLYKRHRGTEEDVQSPEEEGLVFNGQVHEDARGDGADSQPEPAAVLPPELSVIVPVYNVAGYAERTLKSILSQSFERLEVIVVDDGSTDDSLARVNEMAARDGRIRVISQTNAGPGAARNAGVKLSEAPYITFADSDDVVKPDAYDTMMRVIRSTGSDVVLGSLERFNSQRTWTPKWVNECHDRDRLGVTAEEFPPIMWDVFLWGKIYRRSSWDQWVGSIPEGILYEDQEASGRLYAGGAKLDVLDTVVYSWRHREDGTSITQQKTSVADLRDRVTVMHRMRDLMETGGPELLDYWFTKVFSDDLYWYYLAAPRAEYAFFQILKETVQELYPNCPREAFLRVPFKQRLMTLAVLSGEQDSFNHVVRATQEIASRGTFWLQENGEIRADFPVLKKLPFEIPSDLLTIRQDQLEVTTFVRRYMVHDDGGVVIEGDCYVDGWDYSRSVPKLTSSLLRRESCAGEDERYELQVESIYSKGALLESTDALNEYSQAGFRVSISAESIEALPQKPGPDSRTPWLLQLHLELSDEYSLTTSLKRKDTRGSAGRLVSSQITSRGKRLVPLTLEDGALAFRLIETPISACEVKPEGDCVSVMFTELPGPPSSVSELKRFVVAKNLVTSGTVRAEISTRKEGYEATLEFPRAQGLGRATTHEWDVRVENPGGSLQLISVNLVEGMDRAQRFVPISTGFGYLRLEEQRQFGEVDEVTVNEADDTVTVYGQYYISPLIRNQNPTFALVSKNQTLHPARTLTEGGRFRVEFDLRLEDPDGHVVLPESGSYIFQLLSATKQSLPDRTELRLASGLVSRFPLDIRGDTKRIVCAATSRGRGLVVDIRPPYKEDESGSYNQRRLQTTYFDLSKSASEQLPIKGNTVLFSAFSGTSIQDSPLALDRVLARNYPYLERVWAVRDHSIIAPEGARTVVLYSRAWYEALATSKFLVSNNNQPHWFVKRTDQRYIQTWHGTPLKRIGNDIPGDNLSLSYRALMQREAKEHWDILLAQSPWAAKVLKRAFGFDGEILVEGYPRNDTLVPSLESEARRLKIRRFFGISSDQKVLLYAPTWRDNVKDAAGRYKHQLFLDPNEVEKAFGSKCVILSRAHSNNLGSRSGSSRANVRDASTYPNINDLMLAADILVTDYSSSMFDFVVTGKPMVFLTPDLEQYRDTVRGFYFDFEDNAPGPICRTTGEVIRYLKSESSDLDIQTRYAEFLRNFAPMDDGRAAERVASRVWGES